MDRGGGLGGFVVGVWRCRLELSCSIGGWSVEVRESTSTLLYLGLVVNCISLWQWRCGVMVRDNAKT